MNISSIVVILVALAAGYILGIITGKLLKLAIGTMIAIAVSVGFYLYFLS